MQKSLFTLWTQQQTDRQSDTWRSIALKCRSLRFHVTQLAVKSRDKQYAFAVGLTIVNCVTTYYGQGTHIVGHWPDTWWFLCTELFPRHLHKQVCFAFTMEAFCNDGTIQEGEIWARIKFHFELLASVCVANNDHIEGTRHILWVLLLSGDSGSSRRRDSTSSTVLQILGTSTCGGDTYSWFN